MKSIVGILFLVLATSSLAEIYKWRDEAGNLHFSDQKPPARYNPVTIEVETSTGQQESDRAARPGETINEGPAPSESTKFRLSAPPRYSAMRITNPSNGAAIRSNNGSLTINCTLKPALSEQAGHKVRFYVDGQAVATSKQCQHTVANLFRGEHTIHTSVIDTANKTLIETRPVKFHLLRASAL